MIGISNNRTSKSELMKYNPEYILDSICLKQHEIEGLNDEYGLDLLFIKNGVIPKEAYDLMVEDSLLIADCEYGREYFRIAQVRKNKKDIEIYARHITISDILTMWCEDVRPTDLNGNGAINWIFDKAIGENWFNVSSNISNVSTAYYQNKNVYQALFDTDNSFLDRWGGEVYRRGFNIQINARVGEDRGVTIRSRKNLTGFEGSSNINKLTTRIYPKGYDGITINEKYIDSPLINNYSKVFSKEVKFDDVRVNDENYNEGYPTLAEAQAELIRRSKRMFEVSKVDVVTSEYRIDFVELSKTEEYKNYSILERTFIGDTVEVIEETLDINIMVRVIKRVYDCLRKERIETTLSNKDIKVKPPTLNDIIKEIETLPNQDDTLQKAKENATNLINAGLQDSNVIVRKDEFLVMDTKDINTAVRVWRWNLGGFGYSRSGYYGTFETAMTMDGAIVADFITTGILNADLIKAGFIRSRNGSTWINMVDGTFSFANGKIVFDGNNFNIDLSGAGLATDSELEVVRNQVNINSEGIKTKVSKGQEFSTEFNQNSEAFNFNIGNGDMNVEINKNGQTIRGGDLLVTGSGEIKTENTIMNRNEIYFKNNNGEKTQSMKNGRFNLFTPSKEFGSIYMGSIVNTVLKTTDQNGITMFGASPCYFMDFAVDYNAHTENDFFNSTPILRLAFAENIAGTPKGVHTYGRTFIHGKLEMTGNPIRLHNTKHDTIFSTNAGTYIGADGVLALGLTNGEGAVHQDLRIQEIGFSKRLTSNIWFDMQGNQIHNAVLTNAYSNTNARTRSMSYKETTAIEGNNKQIRLPITGNVKGGSCRINIPNEFLGIMDKYTIVGLTKFGKGDIYIAEEFDDYFRVECDTDIKFTLDLIILKNDIEPISQNGGVKDEAVNI